jgi:hypothetical protein
MILIEQVMLLKISFFRPVSSMALSTMWQS